IDTQDLIWDETPKEVVSFVRPERLGGHGVRSVMNMGTTPYRLPEGEVLLTSSADAVVAGELAPNAAAWLIA
ncbi:MAG: hypothetical protein EBR84_03410, partial [Actinobacteria bacterium]|nr:hypothetical protein [Actinomycetota bacterium]